jgi:Acetyl/propionyl-CoA carboxylase, alpha subunit
MRAYKWVTEVLWTFLFVDPDNESYFIDMNTNLQVEHPVSGNAIQELTSAKYWLYIVSWALITLLDLEYVII